MNIAEALMLAGAVIWTIGEVVFAVILHRGSPTTTYVRRYTKGHFFRQSALVAFAVWFCGHMLLNWPP